MNYLPRGWLQTEILLIFASLGVRVIGISYRHSGNDNF
jgi:hypothetical protein